MHAKVPPACVERVPWRMDAAEAGGGLFLDVGCVCLLPSPPCVLLGSRRRRFFSFKTRPGAQHVQP